MVVAFASAVLCKSNLVVQSERTHAQRRAQTPAQGRRIAPKMENVCSENAKTFTS